MIRVNQIELNDQAIVAEMQYHPAETHEKARQLAAESLVIATLLKQRAAELGLDIRDDSLDESEVEQLLEQDIDFPLASEADCQVYFDHNPEKFTTSPLVEAKHILLAVSPDDAEGRSRALEQAQLLISEIQQNPDAFDALARAHSACPSKETGGSLGQLSKGQTVPEFERQLFRCEPGLVASPIESRFGIHVVYIAHQEPGQPLPYDMVATRIRDYLNEKVRRKAIAQYIESLIQQADIEGFDFKVSDSPLMQ